MNENIDLTKILKDCPQGTKLYSSVLGDVEFWSINGTGTKGLIYVRPQSSISNFSYSSSGTYLIDAEYKPIGECTLFPSRDQRDWSKFKAPKKKCEFKPFQKVIARNGYTGKWKLDLFSHYDDSDAFPYRCVGGCYVYCLPYEGNWYLLGTTNNSKE